MDILHEERIHLVGFSFIRVIDMKKRRVGAAVLIGSANGRGLNVGFGAF